MVRTLDPALTAALNALTRSPALTLTIEDHVIHYGLYQSPNGNDAWNDACIANDNSIIRCYVSRGGFASTIYVQRITDPTQASQWQTWSALPGGSGNIFQDGGVAISNNGSNGLRIFAQQGTGGNSVWNWYSQDNGVSWSNIYVTATPPGGALTKGIASAGQNDVFFLYDVVGGEDLGYVYFLGGGNWSSINTWGLPPIAAGAGVAVAWANSAYTVVYSDGYSLSSVTYTPGSNSWSSAANSIAPATSTAIGRFSPRITYADGLYTLTNIESDSGILTGSVYSYPRLRQSADLIHWSNGMILHDLTCIYGAGAFKLTAPQSGNAGPRYYIVSMPTIFSAPAFQNTNLTQYLDVSAAVLTYQRREQSDKPSRLEALIDNNLGVYDALLSTSSTYQPIGLNANLVLSEGYKTGTPPTVNDVVKVGTYHIEQIHIVRSPQENQILLVGLDITRNLDLASRYQNTYTNQTVGFLVAEICARAGLFSPSMPATTQMSQVVPTFVLQAGQSYRHALDEICNTYSLSYFLDQNETLQFRELSSSDLSVWTYQPEIELVSFGSNDQRANHIIVSGKPPAGGQTGALTTAEAYDDTNLHLVGVERLLHHVDQKLTTTSECGEKATFLLQQETRAQTIHTVTVPLNPALQLLDGITLIDSAAPHGSGQQSTCRITHVLAHYDAQKGMDDLQLTLEGM
jgi:hypothetical protein